MSVWPPHVSVGAPLLSIDSTMKSNVTVGPPVDLLAYYADELEVTRHRRFGADDADLNKIRVRWEQALRKAVLGLPEVRFRRLPGAGQQPRAETIQLVETDRTGGTSGAAESELQSQMSSSAPDRPQK